MAQVVVTDQQVIAESWAMWVRTVVLGAAIGVVFWVISVLFARYVVEPLVCRQVIDAAMCTNATPIAGMITTVLVAVAGIVAMVRMGIARPIIVAVAAAALLWDLSTWTQGLFWLEAIAWSVILYGLAFALFAWITRYASLLVTVILSVLIVLVIRIALVL